MNAIKYFLWGTLCLTCSIVLATNTNEIMTGAKPVFATISANKLYVENFNGTTVSVIDSVKNTVKTIPVGSGPLSAVSTDKYVYVNNSRDSTVTVIDANKDAVVTTISVPKGALYSLIVDKYLYVLGPSDISIIDQKNKVIKTLPTGNSSVSQYFTIGSDKRVYLYHPKDTTITILDTKTNTIKDIKGVGRGFISGIFVGKNLYGLNQSSSIFFIDMAKGGLMNINKISTIPTGHDPANIISDGNKIYVSNTSDNTVSVIDTQKNRITKTLTVGLNPGNLYIREGILLVMNTGDKTVSLISTKTDTIIKTVESGIKPVFGLSLGKKFFVLNQDSHSVSTIDFDTPMLVSFTTDKVSNIYNEGTSITIRANFDREILRGSTMEITLNNKRVVQLTYRNTKTLSGVYFVKVGDDVDGLTVKSINKADVRGSELVSGALYPIPDKKNLGDDKIIMIKTTKK